MKKRDDMMNEETGLSQRTLETFLNNTVRIRLKSNGKYINGKLVSISASDLLLEKSDGRRVGIVRSEAIDVADID